MEHTIQVRHLLNLEADTEPEPRIWPSANLKAATDFERLSGCFLPPVSSVLSYMHLLCSQTRLEGSGKGGGKQCTLGCEM